MTEKITHWDVELILIDKKPGISMDEIIDRLIKLDTPLALDLPKICPNPSYLKYFIEQDISTGYVKETTEKCGSKTKTSYSLTDKGIKEMNHRLEKLINLDNPDVVNKINKYLGL